MSAKSLILPVDKPAGWTSFDVVAKLRGGLRWKKVGHAGTLDPMATGMLVLLFGDATQRTEEFMGLEKEYMGTIRLGATTTTDDAEGEVIEQRAVSWNTDSIRSVLREFVGVISQRPPAVSAVKVGGRRSYDLARMGKNVALASREVQIYGIEIESLEEPDIHISVRCGRGTYIRSIARDVGEKLGCGGMLTSLVRTRIGRYEISRAWQIDELLGQPEFKGKN